ncbi:MAG: ComEC/Rec2 family competence protein, partial [Kiritimatiellae bacterium]|nr:ComEC/Rec2 family competence protein [Kiritimatiellia bacterium]
VPPLADFGDDSDALIADEFKASGINHVLAVSGQHVTIITIMFMGIFTLLKISKKVYVPFVVFALVVFAIITGARPSTLRAVIMNSLFLLTWGYMGQGVRSSALLGVPVAAFIILIQNPAMAVDPSFTLSFGAILSLALLTQPFFDLFKKAQGNDFIALCILVAVLTWVFAAHWLMATTVRFWILFAVLAAVLFGLSKALTKAGFTPIGNYGFADIPVGISGFIAAQFGMQIGMMIPLSAYYFYRWPVAGAYANLLAIPLVGVVLQLSMLAGLIGLIPGIGIYIALFLNAANWIFSTAFLLIGRYFSSWFVYPFVTKPTLAWLFVYYACCALFIWWRPLWYRHARPVWRRASASGRVFSVADILAVVLLSACGLRAQKTAMLDEGKLDVAVLSVGYGSGIYVGTPDGKSILIDTAFVQTDRGRRNDAERTIMPFLCSRQIKRLDAVILTTDAPEHTAGLPTILEYLDVDELLYPASAASALDRHDIASILAERSAFRHRLSDTTIPRRALSAGDRLFESEYEGKPFAIEVLGPAATSPLTLRIVYGDTALLLCGELTFPQQQALLDRVPADALSSGVVIAPSHGTAGLDEVTVGMPNDYDPRLAGITGTLLKRTGAETVIFEFGNPRPVVQDKYKIAVRLHGAAKRAAEEALPEADILATDIAGSVTLASDGTAWTVSSRFLTETGETDAPTSLEVGW